MRARHPQLSSSAQLQVLLHASRQVVDRIPAADCLLCDWESILEKNNTATSPNETLVVTLDQFRRHVGSHMEQLALFALPRNYKNLGAEGNSNEAAAVAGSNASSRGSIGHRTLSWRSISSVAATQDPALPDINVEETSKPVEEAAHSSVGESSSYAWSRVQLTHKPVSNQAGFPVTWAAWTDSAFGQTCLGKGEIFIHGGLVNRLKIEDSTCVINMSEGKGTVSFLGLGPGPRVCAAAVSDASRNAFLVWGGHARRPGHFDTALYWLDTSKRLDSS